MRREIPTQWQRLMDNSGFSSVRRLAEAAGVAHTVVARIIHSDGTPRDESVVAVAEALGQPAAKIYALMGQSVPDVAGRWVPPEESARLSGAQRDALATLIRTMVDRPGWDKQLGDFQPRMTKADLIHPPDLYGLAAHPPLDTVEAQERRTADGRGEESQEHPGE